MTKIATTRRFSIRLVIFASVFFFLASASSAIEPAAEFLEGLKERQYYDMAIEYLNEIGWFADKSTDIGFSNDHMEPDYIIR